MRGEWIVLLAAVLATAAVYAGPFDDVQPPGPVPALVPITQPTAPTNNQPSTPTQPTQPTNPSTPPATQPTQPPSSPYQPPLYTDPGIDEPLDDFVEPDYSIDDEPADFEEPSGGAGFFSVTTMLLILVPILVGAGAWYVLTHKKTKGRGSELPPLTMESEQQGYPPLHLPEQVMSTGGPLQTLMMSQPAPPRVQFDQVMLRKAKQYVASLRGQNIPDHKIARAMREADWPAAYIEESMKTEAL